MRARGSATPGGSHPFPATTAGGEPSTILQQLLSVAQELRASVELRDRFGQRGFAVYSNCFVASAAVTWLAASRHCATHTRPQAVALGLRLQKAGFFHAATPIAIEGGTGGVSHGGAEQHLLFSDSATALFRFFVDEDRLYKAFWKERPSANGALRSSGVSEASAAPSPSSLEQQQQQHQPRHSVIPLDNEEGPIEPAASLSADQRSAFSPDAASAALYDPAAWRFQPHVACNSSILSVKLGDTMHGSAHAQAMCGAALSLLVTRLQAAEAAAAAAAAAASSEEARRSSGGRSGSGGGRGGSGRFGSGDVFAALEPGGGSAEGGGEGGNASPSMASDIDKLSSAGAGRKLVGFTGSPEPPLEPPRPPPPQSLFSAMRRPFLSARRTTNRSVAVTAAASRGAGGGGGGLQPRAAISFPMPPPEPQHRQTQQVQPPLSLSYAQQPRPAVSVDSEHFKSQRPLPLQLQQHQQQPSSTTPQSPLQESSPSAIAAHLTRIKAQQRRLQKQQLRSLRSLRARVRMLVTEGYLPLPQPQPQPQQQTLLPTGGALPGTLNPVDTPTPSTIIGGGLSGVGAGGPQGRWTPVSGRSSGRVAVFRLDLFSPSLALSSAPSVTAGTAMFANTLGAAMAGTSPAASGSLQGTVLIPGSAAGAEFVAAGDTRGTPAPASTKLTSSFFAAAAASSYVTTSSSSATIAAKPNTLASTTAAAAASAAIAVAPVHPTFKAVAVMPYAPDAVLQHLLDNSLRKRWDDGFESGRVGE